MNCDRLAPFYERLEKTAFGGRLQRHRVMFLEAAADKRRVLVVGDGDGRFAEALISAYPDLEVDWLEISAGMVAQARKRLGRHRKLRLVQADLLGCRLQEAHYDLLFTHFFLDCFDNQKVSAVIGHLSRALTSNAEWVISDFRQATAGWRKLYTGIWLTAMYAFFRIATGLETSRLPQFQAELEKAGFRRTRERTSMAGLIASEWWQR